MLTYLIESNQVCNFSCKYCFYNKFRRSKSFIKLHQLKTMLENVNQADFYITGGEPFLNPEIVPIIKYLSCNGFVSVFTNSSLITKEVADEIFPHIKMLFVSIDGFEDENNDRGHTDEVLNKINYLLTKAKDKITIKSVLYGQTYEKYKHFIETLVTMGVSHFSVNVVCEKYISPTQKNELKKILEWIQTKKELFPINYIKILYDYYILGEPPSFDTCLAGTDFFYIFSDGKIEDCPDNKSRFIGDGKKNCFGLNCIAFWEFFAEKKRNIK